MMKYTTNGNCLYDILYASGIQNQRLIQSDILILKEGIKSYYNILYLL